MLQHRQDVGERQLLTRVVELEAYSSARGFDRAVEVDRRCAALPSASSIRAMS